LILVLQAWIRAQVKFFVHNVTRVNFSVTLSVKPVVKKFYKIPGTTLKFSGARRVT